MSQPLDQCCSTWSAHIMADMKELFLLFACGAHHMQLPCTVVHLTAPPPPKTSQVISFQSLSSTKGCTLEIPNLTKLFLLGVMGDNFGLEQWWRLLRKTRCWTGGPHVASSNLNQLRCPSLTHKRGCHIKGSGREIKSCCSSLILHRGWAGSPASTRFAHP